ncbi:MAG: hypothetical protein LUC33_02320 [Prevotellaceae bacterium]|nr:hypothetical protein [Prevotellaceae bacterium]
MRRRDIIIIAATALVAITLCSTCSPLYAFNVSADTNCFMTVGKSMLHGLMPYRDLFEHKGPLHIMLHALAAMVSERTFLGAYLLELVCAFGFLYWGYKTMLLCLDEERRQLCLSLVPVLAAFAYASMAFMAGDACSEELLLPLTTYALYVGVKAIRGMRLPTVAECLWVGFFAGCALWIKFTLLGVFVGWYLFFAYWAFRTRHKVDAAKMLGWLALGALIPTIFVLAFFALHHALSDLFGVYFLHNMQHSARRQSSILVLDVLSNLLKGLSLTARFCLMAAAPLVAGMVLLGRKKEKRLLSFLVVTFSLSFLLAFGGQAIRYYAFVFFAFVPLVLGEVADACLGSSWLRLPSLVRRHKFTAVVLCCLVYVLLFSPNTCNIGRPRSDYPQYRFAEIIKQKPGATLLNYGSLDLGFFTTTGIVPNCLYFCYIKNVGGEEGGKAQDEYVEKGMVDFVVVDEYADFHSERYELVAEATYQRFPKHSLRGLLFVPSEKCHSDRGVTYRLYQLKE